MAPVAESSRWLLAIGEDRRAVQWLTAVALANGRRLDPTMPFLPVEVTDTWGATLAGGASPGEMVRLAAGENDSRGEEGGTSVVFGGEAVHLAEIGSGGQPTIIGDIPGANTAVSDPAEGFDELVVPYESILESLFSPMLWRYTTALFVLFSAIAFAHFAAVLGV